MRNESCKTEYGTLSILKQGTLNPAFTMVNRDFVDTLLQNNPQLLPDPTPGGPTVRMLAEHKDLKWNRNTDADILEKLETVENKQGYIKKLIRDDIHTKP